MNATTLKTLVVAGSLAVGAAAGAVLTKVVNEKVPAAKPALGWIAAGLVGVGATLLATPVTKSEAASILASRDDSE